jgi:hypothetical protein
MQSVAANNFRTSQLDAAVWIPEKNSGEGRPNRQVLGCRTAPERSDGLHSAKILIGLFSGRASKYWLSVESYRSIRKTSSTGLIPVSKSIDLETAPKKTLVEIPRS